MRNNSPIPDALRVLFSGHLLVRLSPLRGLLCLAAGLAFFAGGYFLGQNHGLDRHLADEAARNELQAAAPDAGPATQVLPATEARPASPAPVAAAGAGSETELA
ncbi:hypothetical protein LJC15_05305, partial [Desulfovibrio sp. OttesenSCG-928-G11]|nr:hypothetical protein [Desulfovibrio sp. OttesenSCG-928-G11]